MAISITIEPQVTSVFAVPQTTVVEASLAIPDLNASQIFVTPVGTITATNVQEALQQLANQNFRTDVEPTTDVEEGDTWYNVATNQFYVYREVVQDVWDWVPIMVGNDSPDSDTLDGGAF